MSHFKIVPTSQLLQKCPVITWVCAGEYGEYVLGNRDVVWKASTQRSFLYLFSRMATKRRRSEDVCPLGESAAADIPLIA